jgi:hypothetical protein
LLTLRRSAAEEVEQLNAAVKDFDFGGANLPLRRWRQRRWRSASPLRRRRRISRHNNDQTEEKGQLLALQPP